MHCYNRTDEMDPKRWLRVAASRGSHCTHPPTGRSIARQYLDWYSCTRDEQEQLKNCMKVDNRPLSGQVKWGSLTHQLWYCTVVMAVLCGNNPFCHNIS